MKRDVADKDLQIAHLNERCEMLDTVSQSMLAFVQDLERATGGAFLTHRSTDEPPSALDLAFLVKKAVSRLFSLHEELPLRFEADFRQRAEASFLELEAKRTEIKETKARREAVARDVRRLHRLAEIHGAEKQSLECINRSLDSQKAASAQQLQQVVLETNEEVAAIGDSMGDLQKSVRSKTEKRQKAEDQARTRAPKRVLDAGKEEEFLNEVIADLRRRVERETDERSLAEEELTHVQDEIERAQEMIGKFKASLTKEQQDSADAVNSGLREFIEQQREEYRRAIANQRKRNMDLEKQKAELVEEERLLAGFLQSLEKQLQAATQRLPSLSDLHKRPDGAGQARRSQPIKARRAPDDGEMQTIKRQILQLKARRRMGRSVLAASRVR
jgi:chromosome segregation ATPase